MSSDVGTKSSRKTRRRGNSAAAARVAPNLMSPPRHSDLQTTSPFYSMSLCKYICQFTRHTRLYGTVLSRACWIVLVATVSSGSRGSPLHQMRLRCELRSSYAASQRKNGKAGENGGVRKDCYADWLQRLRPLHFAQSQFDLLDSDAVLRTLWLILQVEKWYESGAVRHLLALCFAEASRIFNEGLLSQASLVITTFHLFRSITRVRGQVSDMASGDVWMKHIWPSHELIIEWNDRSITKSKYLPYSGDTGCTQFSFVFAVWRLPSSLVLLSIEEEALYAPWSARAARRS